MFDFEGGVGGTWSFYLAGTFYFFFPFSIFLAAIFILVATASGRVPFFLSPSLVGFLQLQYTKVTHFLDFRFLYYNFLGTQLCRSFFHIARSVYCL